MQTFLENAFDKAISESVDNIDYLVHSYMLEFGRKKEEIFEIDIPETKSFKEKMLKVFKDILDAIKKFVDGAILQIRIQAQKIKLNSKLKELKDMMAKKRSRAVNKRYNLFDIVRYKKFYTDFMNRYTAELIKGLNKDFKSVNEYERWKNQMMDKLSDFNYKLTDEEMWKLSTSINTAVEVSVKEAENREKNLKMVQEQGSKAIKQLESYYRKIDIENSLINYEKSNQVRKHIFKLKHSFIGLVCSKIAQFIKTIFRIVTKHTFACVTALIVVLIAL